MIFLFNLQVTGRKKSPCHTAGFSTKKSSSPPPTPHTVSAPHLLSLVSPPYLSGLAVDRHYILGIVVQPSLHLPAERLYLLQTGRHVVFKRLPLHSAAEQGRVVLPLPAPDPHRSTGQVNSQVNRADRSTGQLGQQGRQVNSSTGQQGSQVNRTARSTGQQAVRSTGQQVNRETGQQGRQVNRGDRSTGQPGQQEVNRAARSTGQPGQQEVNRTDRSTGEPGQQVRQARRRVNK